MDDEDESLHPGGTHGRRVGSLPDPPPAAAVAIQIIKNNGTTSASTSSRSKATLSKSVISNERVRESNGDSISSNNRSTSSWSSGISHKCL